MRHYIVYSVVLSICSIGDWILKIDLFIFEEEDEEEEETIRLTVYSLLHLYLIHNK